MKASRGFLIGLLAFVGIGCGPESGGVVDADDVVEEGVEKADALAARSVEASDKCVRDGARAAYIDALKTTAGFDATHFAHGITVDLKSVRKLKIERASCDGVTCAPDIVTYRIQIGLKSGSTAVRKAYRFNAEQSRAVPYCQITELTAVN